MRKLGLGIGVLASCLWVSQALAAELNGVVRDGQGQPVAGAIVEWVGTNRRAVADAEGRFVLEDLQGEEVELHVMAPNLAHRNLHVRLDDGPVAIRLVRTPIEVIEVTALPWHASSLESAQPVSVLGGEQLRRRQASTLGETLKGEVGVHTNYYGPVASSPVIRGLEGPRVMITQNGLAAGDVSRVGPDHLVATEASTAEQIEVLRGPSTLFYGSGAIGGVVNIVDGRVPRDNQTEGEWHIRHNDVADENLASGRLTGGTGNWAGHIDGFWRESNDYRIPGPAERHDDHDDHGHEEHGSRRLDDSAYEAKGGNIGGSYLLDNGFVGLSYGRLERVYGIPGHSHESHDHGDGEEEDVKADLVQDRWQLHSELSLGHNFFSALNTSLGYTEYTHSEIEFGEALTTFDSTSHEARVELFHHPIAGWHGAWSFQYKREDMEAEGLEAFTPPSLTETLALAWKEERHFGDVQLQLGARAERVELSADAVTLPREGEEGMLSVYSVDQVFEPFSLSAGTVWSFTPGYNASVALSYAQRAPSAAELYSFGPHIGTGTFDVGALFELHEDDHGHDHGHGHEDFHFAINPASVELETSRNIDISLKKYEGDFGFILNAFFNQIDDFYYLTETGFTADDGHDHDHGHDDHGDEGGLPVFIYTAQDAELYGFEGQFVWQATDPLKLTLMTDYTRASLRDGGDLPRIPPLRVGAQADYELGDWGAELSAHHYFKQDRVESFESESDRYTLVDAQINYQLQAGRQSLTFYLQGSNLTNVEARPHTSFIKDKAPLPARGFAVGIRSQF